MRRKRSAAASKVPITERALIQRINRKLQKQPNPEVLRTARTERQREELGEYYTLETGGFGQPQRATSHGVARVHVKLLKLAIELGVLKPWEQLDE